MSVIASLLALVMAAQSTSVGSAASTADTPVKSPAPTEVVVVAKRPQTIADVVQQFAAPTGQDGRLARWDGQVCPGVLGLDKTHSEYLNDKLAATALAVGLKVGEPGCTPDILIVVTSETDRLMQALSGYKRRLGVSPGSGDYASGGSVRQTFADFLKTPRPVRWWHVSEEVPADGSPMVEGVMQVFSPSRLRSSTKEQFRHVLIVVDAKSAAGVRYEALASYISMVALAQLPPTPPIGKLPTILTLFADRDAGRTPPADLTSTDLGYLKGLYASRVDAPDLQTQNRDIIRSMEKPEPAAH